MVLLPWELDFIHGITQPDVTTAALSVARKNGKTPLVSFLACAAFEGPLSAPGGEATIVAASFQQAIIAFRHIKRYLGSKINNRNIYRVLNSTGSSEIEDLNTGCRVIVKAANPRTAHGLASVFTLLDEPAKWAANTRDEMVAAMETGTGAYGNEKIIALGTRPDLESHFFQRWLDGEADYSQCHTVIEEEGVELDIFDEAVWEQANPSLEFWPWLYKSIADHAERAKTSPEAMQTFKSLRLNMGVSETHISTHL